METKQPFVSEYRLGQDEDKERNQSSFRIQRKLIHSIPKCRGHNESCAKRQVHSPKFFFIKKLDSSHTSSMPENSRPKRSEPP